MSAVVRSNEGNTVLKTYAFLDSESSATFCTESLMRRMNITGEKVRLLLNTINGPKYHDSCHIANMEMSSLEEDNFIQVSDVFTQETMPVSHPNVHKQKDLERWPHLKEVKLPKINSGIDLLIGTNASEALEPIEVITNQEGGPFAMRTVLGWVIYGPLRKNNKGMERNNYTAAAVNRISIVNLEESLTKQHNHDFNERAGKESEEMSGKEKIYTTKSSWPKSKENTQENTKGHEKNKEKRNESECMLPKFKENSQDDVKSRETCVFLNLPVTGKEQRGEYSLQNTAIPSFLQVLRWQQNCFP
ncbi:uncharacterized protein LOC144609514 [Rhinoraja longicauda]